MIKVKVYFGIFVIRNGIYTGPVELEGLFDIISQRPIEVWEGPEDYALAKRMVDGVDHQILETDFPETGEIN